MKNYIDKEIVNDYINCLSIEQIKKKHSVCYNTIKKLCQEHNIWRDKEIRKYTDKRVTINQELFKNLDDEETQYWLGFLAADGFISKDRNAITLAISNKDIEHLKKYQSFLNDKSLIKTTRHRKFTNSLISKLSFSSLKVKETLISYGITPQKSFTLKMNIPLTNHFIRGLIDGDGHIGFFKNKNKCVIEIFTASIDFRNQITDYLKTTLQINVNLYQKDNTHIIRVSNFINCKKLVTFLYTDSNIYLERKYYKAQLISDYKLKTYPKFRELESRILSETHVNNESN